jgi:putative N6-adenine-specific DNA methylase
MIAKNIAPGLKRTFAFEALRLVDFNTIEDERAVAKKDRFDGEYKIYATDIDPEMIRIAEDNTARA